MRLPHKGTCCPPGDGSGADAHLLLSSVCAFATGIQSAPAVQGSSVYQQQQHACSRKRLPTVPLSRSQSHISRVRFVAVSATIPNMADLAAWLHVPPIGVRQYGEELRPCKVTDVVGRYTGKCILAPCSVQPPCSCHCSQLACCLLQIVQLYPCSSC